MISIFLFPGNHIFFTFFIIITTKGGSFKKLPVIFSFFQSSYITKYQWTIVFWFLFLTKFFPVGISVPLYYRPKFDILIGISFYDAEITNCLFTTIYHVSTPDVFLKFLGLLGLDSCSSPFSVPCVSDLRVKWGGCLCQRNDFSRLLSYAIF